MIGYPGSRLLHGLLPRYPASLEKRVAYRGCRVEGEGGRREPSWRGSSLPEL